MTGQLRHMLRDDDVNHEEQKQILELGMKFRANRFYRQPFAGPQGVAVLFDKPSTRTRSSFSIGVAELGGYPLVIDKSGSQLGRGEPVADTARVLTRMAYGIVWRTFGQDRVEEMARYATCPVVNALTDEFHPCQILADFLTIAQFRGGVDALTGKTIAYLGDAANNMANSYLLGGAVAGMHVRVAGPYGYLPDAAIVADAERIPAEDGGGATACSPRPAARSSSPPIRRRPWPAPTACSLTPGCRWARRPSTRCAPSRSGIIRSTTSSWRSPSRTRCSSTACRRTAARRSPRR